MFLLNVQGTAQASIFSKKGGKGGGGGISKDLREEMNIF